MPALRTFHASSTMKIAILGGGHGCYAAAADLSEKGHEVRLWRRDAAALQAVQQAGSITLKDAAGTRDVPIALATADIAQALRGRSTSPGSWRPIWWTDRWCFCLRVLSAAS
jgi:2-polyprenyl-6-methoxyphenol hydroxylase-like FAD-dependent oxidoreductase